MIIRLIPPPPFTVILFTVSWNKELPSALSLPPFYTNQLHLLAQHDLDKPPNFHSLDKTTWLIPCLHEVTFDLSMGNGLITIRCIFIDGDIKEWTFRSERCMAHLSDVCQDVQWAAMQSERDRYERYQMQQESQDAEALQPKKHKKQRSLLMTLVSSLVPTSPGRTRGASPPPSPRRLPPPPAPSKLSAHTLRRRARSSLVDAFRRYVVTGLSQYFPSGSYGCGYVPFVVRSMLRRNEDRMAALLREAGIGNISMYSDMPPRRPILRGSSSDSPFYDDEDAEETSLESRSTDTDGSSVHTPTDPTGSTPFLPTPSPSPTPRKMRHSHDFPRTPTPPSPTFIPNPQTLSNIHALNNTSHRLQYLLTSLAQARVASDSEDKQALAVLEVKSRRRAWSNRDLLGGARICDVGFGMPEHSSPLARCVTNAEDVDLGPDLGTGYGMEEGWNGSELVRKMRELSLKKTPSKMSLNSVSRLFPVSEEDEDDHVDLQTTSRVALDMYGESESDHGHEAVHGYAESYGYTAEDFDGMTPSVRLVEDAENGLLMPLPLPLTPSPTPPSSPTHQSFPGSEAGGLTPPPRRERKKSMMNRPPLPVLDVEMSLRQDPDLPVPTPGSGPGPTFDQHVFYPPQYPHQAPHYHHGHPLMQTGARYKFDPQTKIEIFDVSYDDDIESAATFSSSASYRSYPSIVETDEPEEFTLAMDVSPPHHMSLPLPVTAYGAKRYDPEEWLVDAGQDVDDVGVRCR